MGFLSRGVPLAVAIMAAATVPAAADGLIATHRLSAALANAGVIEAVAACAKENYAETAVVVDADGVRIAELRGDGAGPHTLDSAYYKAYTAASLKTDTTVILKRATESKNPTLAAAYQIVADAAKRDK